MSASGVESSRRRLSLRWFIVLLLVGAIIVVSVGARIGLIDSDVFRGGVGSRTEVEPDQAVILEALTEKADLVVAERTIAPVTVEVRNVATVRIPIFGEQDLPTAIAGESEVGQLGPGRVELRVDLAGLRPGDITIENGTVTATAPLPRIAEVDEGPVETLNEETGVITRAGEVVLGDGQVIQQQEIADTGHDQMLAGARQDAELFERGRASLERTLRRLLSPLPGVDDVRVELQTVEVECRTHDAPGFCAANRGDEVTGPSAR